MKRYVHTYDATMGKSQFALLLICSFTLKVKPGFALRCYGCTRPFGFESVGNATTMANDAPPCTAGLGKEFDCTGSCTKVSSMGISESIAKQNVSLLLVILLLYLAERFCITEELPTRCAEVTVYGVEAVTCWCNSDLCNNSAKTNVSMDQLYIFNNTSHHNSLFRFTSF